MRSITILCSGILAFSLLAAPAKADPTSNQMFAVFDYSGFAFDGTANEGPDLLILNLAAVTGGFPAIGLDFGTFSDLPFLGGLEYFGVGSAFEHLVLTADIGAIPNPIPADFEMSVLGDVSNMGGLSTLLGMPGGMAFVSLGDFEEHFGYSIGTFTGGGESPIGWDTTTFFSVSGDTENDLHGFPIPPVFLGTMVLTQDISGSTFVPAPEPGLALLVLVGLAGAGIARRRRRTR